MNFTQKIFNNLPTLLALLIWAYVLVPFLAPVAFKYGYEELGISINEFYEYFCHQRVERSIFLFSQDSFARFYTVEELKNVGAIDQVNPNPKGSGFPEYFGHDYYGNEEVGWKVPICIRDIALYGSLALSLTVLLIRRRNGKKDIKIHGWILLALLIPMAVDGVLQTVLELMKATWVPAWFIHSISKRVITGVLFGSSLGVILFNLLLGESSLTKKGKK